VAIGDVLLLPFFRLPYLNSRLFMCWKQQQPDETTTQEKWERVLVLCSSFLHARWIFQTTKVDFYTKTPRKQRRRMKTTTEDEEEYQRK